MPTPGSPTVRRRRLAGELRRLREHHGLNGDDVAERLGWSASKVSRIENAKQTPRLGDVRRLLDLYAVESSYRDQLLELARDAARKGWWQEYSGLLPEVYPVYIGLEVEAEAAWQYAVEVLPGLLQTEDYARGVIQPWQLIGGVPPSQIEARIAARLARQKLLTRQSPLQFSVVLDESVLLRSYGDRSVMRAQFDRLVQLAGELPNLALQVLPLDGPHPISTGSFTLLQFPQVSGIKFHDVVYVEHLNSCSYIEDDTETYRHRLSFDRISAEALAPSESLERISKIARDVWGSRNSP